ncbi:MAG: four helix bundle protein [Thermodesulfobacteriota bacterium]|nr:four helix bundle protein [Thermodesulfobacteriota bacterium]
MDGKKIDERMFEFALKIIQAYNFLIDGKEFVLSKQLLRAGTSIGANVQEAQAAQR